MLLSEEKFYTETLDLSLPALVRVAERYREGDIPAAEHAFVAFLRDTLRPSDYFNIPYYARENAWARAAESDRAAADRIVSGEMISVGFAHTFPEGKVDWNSNPTYNGYKEWTWQLSRHHEFRCLARVYRDTGDETYARRFSDLMTSWLEQAPCPADEPGGTTLTWRTIEAGIRMTKNWHYAIHAFLFSPSISDHTWTLIFRSLWEHAYRLTHASTSGNWLIMEMTGLLHIAVLYPFFRESGEWKRTAFDTLTRELLAQVYPDGFQIELSTNYHEVVLMNYLFDVDICHAMGEPIPADFNAGIYRLYAFYAALPRPNGRLPDLNDGTDFDVRAAFRRGLAYYPGDPLFTFFATAGREGRAPDFLTAFLPYSGMVAMRTDWGEDAIWAFFESAPFGKGHQHEDKLNILLYAYGTDMLRDSGNYAYDNSDMRKYILGTRAHNTGLVDGYGQNRRKNYRWSPDLLDRRSDLRFAEKDEYAVAEGMYNEGYGPDLIAVCHTRRIVFVKKGVGESLPFFLIFDRFESGDDRPHRFEVSFQLDTDPFAVGRQDLTVTYHNGARLTFLADSPVRLLMGQHAPVYIGWRSVYGPEEHEHAPAPVLSYEKSGRSADFVTLLYPAPADAGCPIHDLTYDGGTVSFRVGDEAHFLSADAVAAEVGLNGTMTI